MSRIIFYTLALLVTASFGGCSSVGPRTHRLHTQGPVTLEEVYREDNLTVKEYHLRDGLYYRAIYRGKFREAELYFDHHGLNATKIFEAEGWNRDIIFGREGYSSTLTVSEGINLYLRERYTENGFVAGGRLVLRPLKAVTYGAGRQPTTVRSRRAIDEDFPARGRDPTLKEIAEFEAAIADLLERNFLGPTEVPSLRVADIEAKYGRWARL